MDLTAGTVQLGERELEISRPDALYWPEAGITKADLLGYYHELAPVMLPYLTNRPATFRVCPGGIEKHCFYRRDLPASAPDWLSSVDYVPGTTGEAIRLPLIDDVAGLVWFANTGAIEVHLWASTATALDTPDQVIFDLDPGDGIGFAEALRAALLVRDALGELGLECYAKTSGGLGVHLYVPIAAGTPYDTVRTWVKQFADNLVDAHPDLIAVPRRTTHLGSHVTVDYAQNSMGRNTAAPYTVRARPGAPVSTPLTWDEVAAGKVRPEDFTLRTVPARVRRHGDPFAPVLAGGQRLPEL